MYYISFIYSIEGHLDCNQTRLPVEGLGRQHSHKTLNPQFVLPTGCAGVGGEAELGGRTKQLLAQLGTHDSADDILLYLKIGA